MGKQIKISKGFDIKIVGAPAHDLESLPPSDIFVLKPSDFKDLTPKLLVAEGDTVLAGQKVFFDKDRPEIGFVSPVSGEVVEIVRVEKRRISEIKILADKKIEFKQFDVSNQNTKEGIKEILLESGCWSYIRQRPFDVIPDITATPKAIFVSLFDTAPLAPDYDFVLKNKKVELKKGLEVLATLSGGNLQIGVPNSNTLETIGNLSGASVNEFKGPHPAGNVGIHIHHISPILPGQSVWYINPQDVCIIGNLFLTGKYDATRIIALGGSGVVDPQYYEVLTGQTLRSIFDKKIKEDNQRIIQGNVLTGVKSSESGYLSFYTNQITVISEGNQPEFLGWILPGFNKLSLSRSYFSWLNKSKTYDLDTNTHGEERAFVVSGQYEKVLPMNIMPVILLKAILAQDIERMEQLGIYEVSEEDFALCEFVCTSKIEVQQIIRQGLELMQKEA
jgi:Na+-transporting NADH:ubiquinone oxidoreductase subunit A